MRVKSFFARMRKQERVRERLGLRYWSMDSLNALYNRVPYFEEKFPGEYHVNQKEDSYLFTAINEEIEQRHESGWYLDQNQIETLNRMTEEYMVKHVPGYYHIIIENPMAFQVFCLIFRVMKVSNARLMKESILMNLCISEIPVFLSGDLDIALDFLAHYQLVRMIYRWNNKELMAYLELLE